MYAKYANVSNQQIISVNIAAELTRNAIEPWKIRHKHVSIIPPLILFALIYTRLTR